MKYFWQCNRKKQLTFIMIDRVCLSPVLAQYCRWLKAAVFTHSPKCITNQIICISKTPTVTPVPFLIPYTHLSTAPGENRGQLATSHLPSPRATWLGKLSEVGLTFPLLTLSLPSLLL